MDLALEELAPVSPLHRVKSFEFLHILRLDRSEFAALVRVEAENQDFTIEELFPASHDAEADHELLEHEEGGPFTYFIKIKSRAGRQRPLKLSPMTAGSYLALPFEVKNGKLRVTFLGNAKQVRGVLQSIEKARMHYRVVSLMDAKFSPNSPVARLTEKQREVLTKAYELGYYDRPRRISSEQLARRLNLAKSTLVAHRRKAERRLVAEVLAGS